MWTFPSGGYCKPPKKRKKLNKLWQIERRKNNRTSQSAVMINNQRSNNTPRIHFGQEMYLNPPGPVTALASFPGSGNTWVRHLLEQLSGEY